MIHSSGQITGISTSASYAVQDQLISKGFRWNGSGSETITTVDIYWYENKDMMLVPPMSNDLHVHTLADFNLNEDGEPIGLTMEDIEVGATYVVREDMKAGQRYGSFIMYKGWMAELLGQEVTIKSTDGIRSIVLEECGFLLCPEMLSHRVDKPLPKPFKDGDRVVCDETLTALIRNNQCAASPTAPLDDLIFHEETEGEDAFIEGEGVRLFLDGSTGRLIGPKCYILHAPATPTYGNIKEGDPCPFTIGQQVTDGTNEGEVLNVDVGPAVCVDWHVAHPIWYGFYDGGFDINTIFPVQATQPTQEPTHTYEFGDKVKAEGSSEPKYFIAHLGEGRCLISNDKSAPGWVTVGDRIVEVWAVFLSDLTPHPTTFTLANRNAIADKHGVTIEGITLTIAELEKALSEAKKYQS